MPMILIFALFVLFFYLSKQDNFDEKRFLPDQVTGNK